MTYSESVPSTTLPNGRSPSLRPALFVVGLAVFLLLAFGIGAALSSSHSQKPVHPSQKTFLHPIAASHSLRRIVTGVTPPIDVRSSLFIPQDSKVVSSLPSTSTTQYSATVNYLVSGSQSEVISFFHKQLAATGWKILSVGNAIGQVNTIEVLAQRASNDGWYWEVGALVHPTSFSGTKNVTPYTLTLFEKSDDA
jgi:hypothetical protein